MDPSLCRHGWSLVPAGIWSAPCSNNAQGSCVFVGPSRHRPPQAESETVLDASEEEGPEEIDSLHIDLAPPLLEEFTLALDPYPRRPGEPNLPRHNRAEGSGGAESPFAALKNLKSGELTSFPRLAFGLKPPSGFPATSTPPVYTPRPSRRAF